MRPKPAALALLAVAAVAVHRAQAAAEGPVLGTGPFLHMIADLDKSVGFYRDTLGFKLNGPPGEHPFQSVPAVANLYGVPGRQFRAAVLEIPGSEMAVELAQWQDAGSPHEHPRVQDPGAATLILHVQDLKALVAHVENAGVAVKVNAHAATFSDPDGFPIELLEAQTAKADLRVSVMDERKTAALYAGVFGIQQSVPGSLVGIVFARAKSQDELSLPFPSPGQGMLRLRVRNIDALTSACKAAGFAVITTGGEPVSLPNGARVIILTDPNNFYFQLMQAAPGK